MDTLTIVGLEGGASGLTVKAQFNPKEISLMFDGVESGVHIQDEIDKLQRLSDVDPDLKRPPKVKVALGAH